MKRLVLTVGGLALLGLAIAALAFGLALRVPPAPDEPDEPGEPASQPPRGLVDSLADLFGIDARAAGTSYRVLEQLAMLGEAELTAADLGDITTTALSGSRDGRELLAAAEPLQVIFDGERVEVGAVIDLREIDIARLSSEAADAVLRLRRYAPPLTQRPIFVALDSIPVARDGDLDLGEHARFRIGSLPLPRFLARAIGLDADLREALTIDLRILELRLVEVRDDRVYLRTSRTGSN